VGVLLFGLLAAITIGLLFLVAVRGVTVEQQTL